MLGNIAHPNNTYTFIFSATFGLTLPSSISGAKVTAAAAFFLPLSAAYSQPINIRLTKRRRRGEGNKHIKLFAVIRPRRRRDERGEKEGKYDFMEYLITTSHPNLHCSAFLCLKANETSVEPCCVHKSPPLSNRKTELLCLDCKETNVGFTCVQHFMKPGLTILDGHTAAASASLSLSPPREVQTRFFFPLPTPLRMMGRVHHAILYVRSRNPKAAVAPTANFSPPGNDIHQPKTF